MKYYVSDKHLKLREYGRNVQMMVEYAKELKDKEERSALCHEIVRIMSQLNPNVKDGPEFKQKLWDHLYHLADFDIDVDSEYPIPTPEMILSHAPTPLPYPWTGSRYKVYGRNVELMVEEAVNQTDPEARHSLSSLVANIMKMFIKGPNDRDSTVEATVCEHLKVLSNGRLSFTPEELNFYKSQANTPTPQVTTMKFTQRNKGYQSQRPQGGGGGGGNSGGGQRGGGGGGGSSQPGNRRNNKNRR